MSKHENADTSTAKLLPCPFCGSSAKMDEPVDSIVGEHVVVCSGCRIRTYPGPQYRVIMAWNRRCDVSAAAGRERGGVSARKRLSKTRHGVTTKYRIGTVSLYLTVNANAAGEPLEVLAKADSGHTADAESICIPLNYALQYGAPAADLAAALRYRRCGPAGGPGQPVSISDAIGLALEGEEWRKKEAT